MITPVEITPNASAGSIKSIRVVTGQRKQVVFRIVDERGAPVDLNTEPANPPAPEANFSPEPPATTALTSIIFKAIPEISWAPQVQFQVTGTRLSQTGYVEFILTENDTNNPGIYRAEVARITNGGVIVDTYQVWVVIEPTVFQQMRGDGPLTINEIRLALLDLEQGWNPGFSNLLDDLEFKDTDIIFAMRRIVDLWNETPPRVQIFGYGSFPYRYWWIEGTSSILLNMSAARYRRNRLAYQAGGVSIDDQSKANEYEQMSQTKMDAFNKWMLQEKARLNMAQAWGVI